MLRSSTFFGFCLAAVNSAFAVSAHGGLSRTTLNIVNKAISPDGYSRDSVLANGTHPGPLISGYKGDTFQINVNNQLHDTSMNTSTTVHWHGIDQVHTNWADGTAFVTQCPIIPERSFLYNFTVPDQAGTFWYHSHESVQYCDGLRGPLVIYDPDDPHKDLYDVDDDTTVISLSDWYHSPAHELLPGPIPPNTTLINSLGRPDGSNLPVTIIEVDPTKRYRFRLVSMSCHPYYDFSIDGHNMTIIEADGSNTEPLSDIDQIRIYPSQRYSFVLEPNQKPGDYWIRAAPLQLGNTSNPETTTSLGLAILRYTNKSEYAQGAGVDPYNITQAPIPKNPLLEQNLHSYGDVQVPELDEDCDDCKLTFDFAFDFADAEFTANGTSYANPTVPVLLQILNGTYTAQELLPHHSVYTLPRNQTIEITMPGQVVGGPHPLHLHGHSFYVVQSMGSNTTNTVNPVLRDTVAMGNAATDNVVIRFRTDNPGPWIMHCHIDFHLALGFAVVLAEAPRDVPGYVSPIPKAWDELCPVWDKAPSHN
ncbi:laccase [Fomitopsis betulina]|nr:laccase [Fomitopsis betulina]